VKGAFRAEVDRHSHARVAARHDGYGGATRIDQLWDQVRQPANESGLRVRRRYAHASRVPPVQVEYLPVADRFYDGCGVHEVLHREFAGLRSGKVSFQILPAATRQRGEVRLKVPRQFERGVDRGPARKHLEADFASCRNYAGRRRQGVKTQEFPLAREDGEGARGSDSDRLSISWKGDRVPVVPSGFASERLQDSHATLAPEHEWGESRQPSVPIPDRDDPRHRVFAPVTQPCVCPGPCRERGSGAV
jgi:hypothetical protein